MVERSISSLKSSSNAARMVSRSAHKLVQSRRRKVRSDTTFASFNAQKGKGEKEGKKEFSQGNTYLVLIALITVLAPVSRITRSPLQCVPRRRLLRQGFFRSRIVLFSLLSLLSGLLYHARKIPLIAWRVQTASKTTAGCAYPKISKHSSYQRFD